MTMEEARETYVRGVTVTRNGEFFHYGKSIKVYRRQTTGKHGGKSAFIHPVKDGKAKTYSAGKLIASAWMDGFDANTDKIGYRDGVSRRAAL